MSETRRTVVASSEKAWGVLADGWLYPLWVVGATRMRDVDESWPAVGSRLHHSAGVWPVVINDNTEVLAVEPGRSLSLRARGWPLGEADVVITLTDLGGSRTEVALEETTTAGPGVLLPDSVEDALLGWRNRETLRRLAFVIEGR